MINNITHYSLDIETYLIEDNVLPKPVCLSWCSSDGSDVGVVGNNKCGDMALGPHFDCLDAKLLILFNHCLCHNISTIWQNGAAFDLPVLYKYYPSLRFEIEALLDAGLVHDTQLREKLYVLSTEGEIDKPRGYYSLNDMVKRYLGKDISKWKTGPDIWRLRYCELDGMSVDNYPAAAREYALLDPDLTNQVYLAQESVRTQYGPGSMNTEIMQIRAAFVLTLITDKGMLVDGHALTQFVSDMQEQQSPLRQQLLDSGFAYLDKKGSYRKQNKKFSDYLSQHYPDYVVRLPITTAERKQAETACEIKLPNTKRKLLRALLKSNTPLKKDLEAARQAFPTFRIHINKHGRITRYTEYDKTLYKEPRGHIDISETALERYPEDPIIQLRLNLVLIDKLLSTYSNNIKKGTLFRSRYDTIKNTGRTSGFIQTFPRDMGIRELFVARPGYSIVTIDISGHEFISTGNTDIELGLGDSWARYLNGGSSPPDPHALLGHKWHEYRTGESISIEDFQKRKEEGDPEIKISRNQAKAPGLSFRGGGSNSTISTISKGEITPEEVGQARFIFEELIPEQKTSLGKGGWVNKQKITDSLSHTFAYECNGRYRNYCTYAACANGKFMQSPAADSAKYALWHMWRHLCDRDGVDMLFFIHDEIGLEIRDDKLEEYLPFVTQLMCQGVQTMLPYMRIAVEGLVMKRWSKKEDNASVGFKAWLDTDKTFHFNKKDINICA